MGQNEKNFPALLKATDVASAVNPSKTHVYFLVRRCDLPAVFICEKAVRFDPDGVQEFIDSRRAKGETISHDFLYMRFGAHSPVDFAVLPKKVISI